MSVKRDLRDVINAAMWASITLFWDTPKGALFSFTIWILASRFLRWVGATFRKSVG